MNEKTFNSLSPEMQKVFSEAILLGRELNNNLVEGSEQEYLEKIKETGKLTEIIVPDDSFRQKGKEIAPILEERGLWSKGLYARVLALTEE